MAAVVRVKRKRTASVADSLLISYKKHCPIPSSNGTDENATTSIFKFVGTVNSKVSLV